MVLTTLISPIFDTELAIFKTFPFAGFFVRPLYVVGFVVFVVLSPYITNSNLN